MYIKVTDKDGNPIDGLNPFPVTVIADASALDSKMDTLLAKQDSILAELQAHTVLLQGILDALES